MLWKKVQTGLSAGRVQSVAVRLIVEREEERRAFRVGEYWDLEAPMHGQGRQFVATLAKLNDQRIASGKDFDPQWHEAIANDPIDGHREGEITAEVRRGYKIGSRLIRAAMVKVAKA